MKQEVKNILMPVLLALVSVLFALPSFAQEPDLVLSTWANAPFTKPDRSGYLDRILIEAFNQHNLQIKIIPMPSERSIKQANEGETDGEFMRVDMIGQLYPNLLMVPESIFNMEFVAFTTRDDVKIDGWQSLEPYRVGIVVGWKILEANVKNTQGGRQDIPEPDNLFRMVAANRLDIAVYSKEFGREIISRLGLAGMKDLGPPLAAKEMYLFLNKKHEQLIPQLAQTLKKMKEDGTFAAIERETIGRRVNQ